MKSIAISLQGNKFITENGRWRFTYDRLEYMPQKVRHAISIFLGEWFFNQTMGIPYIPDDNTNNQMHRRLIESRLQATIIGVKGIARIVSFKTILNKATRELTVTFTAQIDSGETFDETIVI
ncbi:hypothetical protein AGMMS49944_09070 [Spirochaetia bacterium]|nr:hypothetical protein AGMMS49944_09070 [Spirochaetia bacterium]